jgi:hypothetical protein
MRESDDDRNPMMTRARIEIEIGVVSMRQRGVGVMFFADSSGYQRLAVTVSDSEDSDETVTVFFDSNDYRLFKELLSTADEVVRKLKECPTIMPLRVIELPMYLHVEIGCVRTAGGSASFALRVQSSGDLQAQLVVTNDEEDRLSVLTMEKGEYRRFRELMRQADQTLDQLYSSRQIGQRFLIRT